LTQEELHDVVDIEKIEPKSVHMVEEWDKTSSEEKPGAKRKYEVVYSFPIAVSRTWQAMFQKPDPTRSGLVHQISFTFSEDGREVEASLRGEPSPELLYVLRSYVKRANERWVPYRENVLKNRDEEQRILKALKDAR